MRHKCRNFGISSLFYQICEKVLQKSSLSLSPGLISPSFPPSSASSLSLAVLHHSIHKEERSLLLFRLRMWVRLHFHFHSCTTGIPPSLSLSSCPCIITACKKPQATCWRLKNVPFFLLLFSSFIHPKSHPDISAGHERVFKMRSWIRESHNTASSDHSSNLLISSLIISAKNQHHHLITMAKMVRQRDINLWFLNAANTIDKCQTKCIRSCSWCSSAQRWPRRPESTSQPPSCPPPSWLMPRPWRRSTIRLRSTHISHPLPSPSRHRPCPDTRTRQRFDTTHQPWSLLRSFTQHHLFTLLRSFMLHHLFMLLQSFTLLPLSMQLHHWLLQRHRCSANPTQWRRAGLLPVRLMLWHQH